LSFPCGDFAGEALGVVDSAIQTLAAEYADLDLDHVEPTGMLGGIVELQAAQNSPGFGRCECLIEGAGRVGRQVVLYDPDARGIWIMDIDKFAHTLIVVFRRPPDRLSCPVSLTMASASSSSPAGAALGRVCARRCYQQRLLPCP